MKMKDSVNISVEHSIMLDELCTMLGLETREEVATFMLLSGTIDYFYHKVKSDTTLQASGKVVTGSGIKHPKGFLKPQKGAR